MRRVAVSIFKPAPVRSSDELNLINHNRNLSLGDCMSMIRLAHLLCFPLRSNAFSADVTVRGKLSVSEPEAAASSPSPPADSRRKPSARPAAVQHATTRR